MPKKPPKNCAKPNCFKLALNGGYYCQSHQPKPFANKVHVYPINWQKIRIAVFQRDNYLCQVCKRMGILREGTEIDHIVSISQGGSHNLSNLQAICEYCHAEKSKQERIAGIYNARCKTK
jgi:5-methylcytosine-specific restriction protein A